MALLRSSLLAALVLFSGARARGTEVTFRSGPAQTHLLELYTSEGCSSCPPAERWLSGLRADPRLWKQIVPLAFHVDYWDHLGWKDRYDSPAWTARQRQWAAGWRAGTIYTPGFVLDGREWTRGELPAPGGEAGVLTAALHGSELAVTFQPAGKSTKAWLAHVTTLGFGLSSDVRAGENSGHRLDHDFVALSLTSAPLSSGTATLRLPASPAGGLAVWITPSDSMVPIQAAGGFVTP